MIAVLGGSGAAEGIGMAGVLVGIGLVLLIIGVLGGSNLWLIGLGLGLIMGAGLLQLRIANRTTRRA
jgi:hypothetical protein